MEKIAGVLDNLNFLEFALKQDEEDFQTGVSHLSSRFLDEQEKINNLFRLTLFSTIQSKERTLLKKAELFNKQGIVIKYTGQQLNQEDMTVWLALIDIMKQNHLETQCDFTSDNILKYMGWEIGCIAEERLDDAILRMTACSIFIKIGKYAYGGGLINDFIFDKDSKNYKITLNRRLVRLFKCM